MNHHVTELQARLEDAEQYSRVNFIEIHGVPEKMIEDVVSMVKYIG